MIKINQLNTNSNALREYKKAITLNQIQKEVIVGTLLGDACMPLRWGNPTLRVRFEQKSARADYIWQAPLGHFVGTAPRVYTRGAGARVYQSLQFQTYSHPEFQFYDSLFYLDYKDKGCSRKKLIKNIGELLTPRALAYWLMDDGTYQSKNQRRYRYYTFSTTGRAARDPPLEDQALLVQVLRDNFGIHATIQKDRSH